MRALSLKVMVCTGLALFAFTGNSVLCRLALGGGQIDAASFTVIRFLSGIGYVIWYIALGGLSTTQAAVVQLLVPVIAAAGGVIFASEVVSFRLLGASMLVLGGILIVVMGKAYFVHRALGKTG